MAKVKIPLEMANGVMVRDTETFKEHFDIEKVVGYFLSGKLLKWLNDFYYEDEAEIVEKILPNDVDLSQKLCEIFEVDYKPEIEIDPELIAKRAEKLSRLKQLTDDEEVIKNVDNVAFNQEELADIYDEEKEKIWLCEGDFKIPKSKRDLEYVVLFDAKVNVFEKDRYTLFYMTVFIDVEENDGGEKVLENNEIKYKKKVRTLFFKDNLTDYETNISDGKVDILTAKIYDTFVLYSHNNGAILYNITTGTQLKLESYVGEVEKMYINENILIVKDGYSNLHIVKFDFDNNTNKEINKYSIGKSNFLMLDNYLFFSKYSYESAFRGNNWAYYSPYIRYNILSCESEKLDFPYLTCGFGKEPPSSLSFCYDNDNIYILDLHGNLYCMNRNTLKYKKICYIDEIKYLSIGYNSLIKSKILNIKSKILKNKVVIFIKRKNLFSRNVNCILFCIDIEKKSYQLLDKYKLNDGTIDIADSETHDGTRIKLHLTSDSIYYLIIDKENEYILNRKINYDGSGMENL